MSILSGFCGQEIMDLPGVDLVESGLLDSLALINLLVRIEEEFGVELQPTQIPPDLWRSVDAIAELITAQRNTCQQ